MYKIFIANLPMPHSVNAGIMPSWRSRKFIKTDVARDYDARMEKWLHNYAPNLNKLFWVKDSIDKGYQIRADYYFLFHVERVIWKRKKTMRPLDVDNRVKPLQDWIAKIIGIDDCNFKKGFREIMTVEREQDECAIVVLSRTNLLQFQTKEQAIEKIMAVDTSD